MAKLSDPKTILDFATQFPHDEVCLKYLIQNRWPDGVVCPSCHQPGGWWLAKYRRFECTQCHRQTSPLAGTLLHRSHLPIHTWCWAAYLMATHTPGISAVQLQRQRGGSVVDEALTTVTTRPNCLNVLSIQREDSRLAGCGRVLVFSQLDWLKTVGQFRKVKLVGCTFSEISR